MRNSTATVLILIAGLSFSLEARPNAPAQKKATWKAYKSQTLGVQIAVPGDWQVRKSPTALGFRSSTNDQTAAAVGIMKSRGNSQSLDEAADKLYRDAHSPASWQRSNARIAGYRAVKFAGQVPQHPDKRMIQYCIQTPGGIYLLQCIAPTPHWDAWSPVFSKIISGIQFI